MKKDKKDEEIVLIRSGNQYMFASVKNGETILLGDPSTFVFAGATINDEQSLVKKLKRRIKMK